MAYGQIPFSEEERTQTHSLVDKSGQSEKGHGALVPATLPSFVTGPRLFPLSLDEDRRDQVASASAKSRSSAVRNAFAGASHANTAEKPTHS